MSDYFYFGRGDVQDDDDRIHAKLIQGKLLEQRFSMSGLTVREYRELQEKLNQIVHWTIVASRQLVYAAYASKGREKFDHLSRKIDQILAILNSDADLIDK